MNRYGEKIRTHSRVCKKKTSLPTILYNGTTIILIIFNVSVTSQFTDKLEQQKLKLSFRAKELHELGRTRKCVHKSHTKVRRGCGREQCFNEFKRGNVSSPEKRASLGLGSAFLRDGFRLWSIVRKHKSRSRSVINNSLPLRSESYVWRKINSFSLLCIQGLKGDQEAKAMEEKYFLLHLKGKKGKWHLPRHPLIRELWSLMILCDGVIQKNGYLQAMKLPPI